MRLFSALATLMLSLCAVQGSYASNPTLDGAFVQIVSVSPTLGTPLRAGESVTLTVEVEYMFPGESGTLNLVVQAADNSAIAHDADVILKGSGKITLTATFTVPATKMIQIFTPLSAQGQMKTSTVDSRAFKVIAK